MNEKKVRKVKKKTEEIKTLKRRIRELENEIKELEMYKNIKKLLDECKELKESKCSLDSKKRKIIFQPTFWSLEEKLKVEWRVEEWISTIERDVKVSDEISIENLENF